MNELIDFANLHEKNGKLFHGLRSYELDDLFPRASLKHLVITDNLSQSSEKIRKSPLTGTTYFSDSPVIAEAYPMFERRDRHLPNTPSQLFPIGAIAQIEGDRKKFRSLEKGEILLINNPDSLLVPHVKVTNEDVIAYEIERLAIVVYYHVLSLMLFRESAELPIKQKKSQIRNLVASTLFIANEVKRRINSAYPFIGLQTRISKLKVEDAEEVVRLT